MTSIWKLASAVSGVSLIAMMTATTAYAQDDGSGDFEVGIELDTIYESNVANLSDERLQLANIERSDIIVSPSVFLNLNKEIGGFSLRGSASLGYDFYTKNSRLDSERALVSLDGETRISLCTVEPGLSFRRQQNDLGNRFFIDTPDLVLDNVQTVQEYRLNVGCGQEIGIRALGGVSFEKGDNSNEIRQLSDFESLTYHTGLGYHHPTIGELDLFVSKEETTYRNRVLDGIEDGYEVRRYGATFERDIGARLKGRVEGFLVDVDTNLGGNTDFKGTGFNFDLSATLGARTSAFLKFGQDVQPVLNNDALYMKARNFGVGASFAVNERVTLNGSFTRLDRYYAYSEFLPQDDDVPLLADKLDQFTASADYRGPGRFGFSLYGGYENRSANDDFYNYSGLFAGMKLRYLLIR